MHLCLSSFARASRTHAFAFWLVPWLSAAGGERRLAIEPAAKEAKRFEKIEFTLRTDVVPENPYDPADMDLRLELTSPSGSGKASASPESLVLNVPAFTRDVPCKVTRPR